MASEPLRERCAISRLPLRLATSLTLPSTVHAAFPSMGRWIHRADEVTPGATVFVARVHGIVVAKSSRVYCVNRRIFFPLASLRLQHFVDSPKQWT